MERKLVHLGREVLDRIITMLLILISVSADMCPLHLEANGLDAHHFKEADARLSPQRYRLDSQPLLAFDTI